MLKKLLMSIVVVIGLIQTLSAVDDYHFYGEWSPDGLRPYGIEGFKDKNGLLGGNNGDEYIFFTSGNMGYIYKVEVAGDPNSHPDVDGNPVATRTFTRISSHHISNARGHSGEFYVDETGIYYGSGMDIKRWDFNWTNETTVVPNSFYTETLARNKTTGDWWTATRGRDVYKYNNTTNRWEHQFRYPSLAGSHHDGMEIVSNVLYISDMTSDKIIAYELNSTGGVSDPSDYNISSYTASPVVEGMGYGPNQHFWMSSGQSFYEIGGKHLTPPCSQVFHFDHRWDMQTSKCDDINVPGFDDTLMVKLENGHLKWVTADAGTIAWLAGLGITAESNLTLKSGEGFWTYGKFDGITKTVGDGKLRDNHVSFLDGVYTFVGFTSPINLNTKFGTKPVSEVYYYNGGIWHTWTPNDGTQIVPANQGLYVLPNADFDMTIN